MKILQKPSLVANRIKIIDFKTFCEGGSPEYVAAKKKLKELYLSQKKSSLKIQESRQNDSVQTSLANFRESNRLGKIAESKLGPSYKRSNLTAYSLYINPLAFFDIHFLTAAGCVVLVAVLEKKLADNGIIAPAAILSGILKIGFPLVAFASILVLISKLGVFL